jgi:hypothetical protein
MLIKTMQDTMQSKKNSARKRYSTSLEILLLTYPFTTWLLVPKFVTDAAKASIEIMMTKYW